VLHIGIDAHAIGLAQGGNERYARGLLAGLAEIRPEGMRFTVFLTGKARQDAVSGARQFSIRSVPRNPAVRLVLSLPRSAVRERLDLLHTQYHLPPALACPAVVTVHDIAFIRYPDCFPAAERLKMRLSVRRSLRKAAKVITVSEFSRREIVWWCPEVEGKVAVIPNGVDSVFRPAAPPASDKELASLGVRRPFILSVGNLQPRKNLCRLLSAYLEVRRRGWQCGLAIVGRKLWLCDEFFADLRNSPYASDIVLTGYLPDASLAVLYGAAECFVYPSLYEGFGLPVAEAMACGCPVVTSCRSSLPEVAGDAALLVNPESVKEIADAIGAVLSRSELRRCLAEKGPVRARLFSWRSAALRTAEVYAQAAMTQERTLR